MFRPGELIKRKEVTAKARALCIIISEDSNNYTLYNLSSKRIRKIARCVVDGLYGRIQE
tara:strand:+ start:224 stop:400 length:177 start_codon:yes stop_codon:yes gene_type:complete